MKASRIALTLYTLLLTTASDSLSLVTVWNTFQDTHVTQGEQVIYDTAGPAVIRRGKAEFVNFPKNPGSNEFGFYEIDVRKDRIVFTLLNNTGATNIVFPDNTFDRYYFEFDEVVHEAELGISQTGITSRVEVLPPHYRMLIGDSFGTGIDVPNRLENGGILLEVVPGADLSSLGEKIVIRYSVEDDDEQVLNEASLREAFLGRSGQTGANEEIEEVAEKRGGRYKKGKKNKKKASCSSDEDDDDSDDDDDDNDDDDNDDEVAVTVWNTIEDAGLTQGREVLYDGAGPTDITLAPEFINFPKQPGSTRFGFYNIDVSNEFISYTLINNTGAINIVFPEGSFDRYYFEFGTAVNGAEIIESFTEINSRVTVLPPGYDLSSIVDVFGIGINVPETLENGGILVEIVEGADLSGLGQHIVVAYSLDRSGGTGSGGETDTTTGTSSGTKTGTSSSTKTGTSSSTKTGTSSSTKTGKSSSTKTGKSSSCKSMNMKKKGKKSKSKNGADNTKLTVWNTFQHRTVTNGLQVIYDTDGPSDIIPGPEFMNFPKNPGRDDSGFYDIDVSKHTIAYTLIDNSGATDLVFRDGSFDRYYFEFGKEVLDAELIEDSTDITSRVEVLPSGYGLPLADSFGTRIDFPNTLVNGGILVEISEGADLSTLGQHIVVAYSLADGSRKVKKKKTTKTKTKKVKGRMMTRVGLLPRST